MEGVSLDVDPVTRRANIVGKTSDGGRVASHVVLLPFSNERNEEVAFELSVEHLTEEVEIGNEGSLENDWDVRSVKQLDGVGSLVASDTSASQLELNSETL